LTALYIWRLMFLTFFGKSRVSHEAAHHLHESPPSMTVPLMILAVLSLAGGWIGWPAVLGGSNRLEHWLEPVFAPGAEILAAHAAHVEHSHTLEYMLMALSVGIAGAGVAAAYYFFLKNRAAADSLAASFSGVHKVLENKYYVDEFYNKVFVRGLAMGGGTALWKFDGNVIDGGVNGSAWLTRLTSSVSIWWDTWIVDGTVRLTALAVKVLSYPVRLLQTGLVQTYALFILFGLLVFFSYYIFG
jgi:NADH-quinone oxidoreductase subunit L